jgi:hypothetical protein
MVWNTLDGRVPPPVRFEIPSSDDGGDAGE